MAISILPNLIAIGMYVRMYKNAYGHLYTVLLEAHVKVDPATATRICLPAGSPGQFTDDFVYNFFGIMHEAV